MSRRRFTDNVALCFTLLILSVTLSHTLGADVISQTSSSLEISNQHSLRSYDETISDKMLQIRHLLKSLFLDWSLGESEGSVARTFGRIRMMRQIMLPMAFLGGFLTAVILGIKATGIFNMLLIGKVLILNMALIIGKILFIGKEFLMSKSHYSYPSYPYYPSHHHPEPHYSFEPSGPPSFSHSNAYASSHGGSSFGNSFASSHAGKRSDNLNQQPTFVHDQFSSPSAFSPQFNQPINQIPSYSQPQSKFPQTHFGQPQNPFMGISMQQPQQLQMSLNLSPYSQGQMRNNNEVSNVELLDNRISNDSVPPRAQQYFQEPQTTTLSPQQMTQLLSNAIAQMSLQVTPKPARSIRKRSPNIFDYIRKSS